MSEWNKFPQINELPALSTLLATGSLNWNVIVSEERVGQTNWRTASRDSYTPNVPCKNKMKFWKKNNQNTSMTKWSGILTRIRVYLYLYCLKVHSFKICSLKFSYLSTSLFLISCVLKLVNFLASLSLNCCSFFNSSGLKSKKSSGSLGVCSRLFGSTL